MSTSKRVTNLAFLFLLSNFIDLFRVPFRTNFLRHVAELAVFHVFLLYMNYSREVVRWFIIQLLNTVYEETLCRPIEGYLPLRNSSKFSTRLLKRLRSRSGKVRTIGSVLTPLPNADLYANRHDHVLDG